MLSTSPAESDSSDFGHKLTNSGIPEFVQGEVWSLGLGGGP